MTDCTIIITRENSEVGKAGLLFLRVLPHWGSPPKEEKQRLLVQRSPDCFWQRLKGRQRSGIKGKRIKGKAVPRLQGQGELEAGQLAASILWDWFGYIFAFLQLTRSWTLEQKLGRLSVGNQVLAILGADCYGSHIWLPGETAV